MRRYGMLSVCIAIAYGQQPDTLASYHAAFYTGGSSYGDHARLEVFPLHGKPFAIPMAFPCQTYYYSPDGEALYCSSVDGLLKIELRPLRSTLIPGSDVFGVNSLAVSARENKIVISGWRKQGGAEERGIFELNPLSGESRILAINDKPKIGNLFPAQSAWQHLAVSPDGKRAVAMRQHTMELIDLTNGSVRTLSTDLEFGAWSADGRWLAALDWRKGHTILMDASTLTPQRILRMSDADWSPDSHYLLGVKTSFLCGPYAGTFQATNVETGKAVTIRSSHCKVKATSGWVSSKIVPE